MPVNGNPINAAAEELEELMDMVRMMMRDYADNNILLMDAQFKEKEIKMAMRLAVSDFNSLPPNTQLSWRLLPEGLLLQGVTHWLLLSESFLQLRNQVSVPTDGLGVVGIDDKSQYYQQLRGQLKSEYDQRCRLIKNEMNIASGYGSLGSGYAGVSRFRQG